MYFYVFHVCKFAFFLLVAVYIMFAQLYIHLVFFHLSATAAGMASVGDIACEAAYEFVQKAKNAPVPEPVRTDIEVIPDDPSPVVFQVDDSDLERTRPTAQTSCRCCQTGASSVCSCQKGSGWYLSTVLDFTILYCSIFDFIFL